MILETLTYRRRKIVHIITSRFDTSYLQWIWRLKFSPTPPIVASEPFDLHTVTRKYALIIEEIIPSEKICIYENETYRIVLNSINILRVTRLIAAEQKRQNNINEMFQ